jgi:tRNA dimethylallyltransferase
MAKTRTVYIIAGPTASGKSARAMELARAMNGIIINCDSLQIYNGLPILTAQPNDSEKAEIPHRLYGELHPNDSCSAGNWREVAEPIIHAVLSEGQTPIIVGGTGLYIKALMDGLSPMPDVPPEIRERAKLLYEELGAEGFYENLKHRDPEMAARFHPAHKARIVRAWEVIEATGKSLAEWQRLARLAPPDDWDFKTEVIIPERSELRARCDARFAAMLENGALEEVEDFAARIESGEIRGDVPLTKALGYAELLGFIRGDWSKDYAVEKAQNRTKRYAKQQVTWFRNQLISS